MEHISLELIFSIIGFIVGSASLVPLVITLRKGPRALRGAIVQFTIGIILVTLAFLWDILFSFETLRLTLVLDLHHLFMALSILFLISAAKKFYKFGR